MTTPRAERPTGPRPWYREPFVWLLILFPAAAVVGGLVTLALAVHTSDGVVVDDYYRRGLEINRSLARDRAAAAHGLSAELVLEPEQARLEVELRAAPGFHLPEALRLGLYHATRPGLDRELFLVRTGAHRYRAQSGPLALGHWHVHLEADDWRLTGRVRAPAGNTRHRLGTPGGP